MRKSFSTPQRRKPACASGLLQVFFVSTRGQQCTAADIFVYNTCIGQSSFGRSIKTSHSQEWLWGSKTELVEN